MACPASATGARQFVRPPIICDLLGEMTILLASFSCLDENNERGEKAYEQEQTPADEAIE